MPGPIPKEGGDGAPKKPDPAGEGNDPNTQPTGTGPDKNPAKGSDAPVDISGLNDEAFGKVFDDPRLWNHPRFKQLNERAKKAANLEADNEKAEVARLEKEKKYKELAEKHGNDAATWKTKYETQIADNKIISEATKLGAVDLDAVSKLIDRSEIKVTDDGVTGIEGAVAKLKEEKSYLFAATGSTRVGAGTNPAGANTGLKFKASEIQDPEFYREHEKEILEAMKTPGAIENDLPGIPT